VRNTAVTRGCLIRRFKDDHHPIIVDQGHIKPLEVIREENLQNFIKENLDSVLLLAKSAASSFLTRVSATITEQKVYLKQDESIIIIKPSVVHKEEEDRFIELPGWLIVQQNENLLDNSAICSAVTIPQAVRLAIDTMYKMTSTEFWDKRINHL